MATTKGIMGHVSMTGTSVTSFRVSSLTLKAVQDISPTDTIDGAYDSTAYVLGPIRVEGDVGFPVTIANNMFTDIMEIALRRNPDGTLSNRNITVNARYDFTLGYAYTNCSVSSISATIAAEEAVDFSMSLIGSERTAVGGVAPIAPAPARVLAWDDVTISSTLEFGSGVTSGQVRNFSFDINNNTTAFFGLDGRIFVFPDNIVAGKREVTGTIEASWNGSGLENYAYLVNQDDCRITSSDTINMDIASCDSLTPIGIEFLGVIYDMEDISMTNDFFMGTQAWRAYGKDSNEFKAIRLNGNAI